MNTLSLADMRFVYEKGDIEIEKPKKIRGKKTYKIIQRKLK